MRLSLAPLVHPHRPIRQCLAASLCAWSVAACAPGTAPSVVLDLVDGFAAAQPLVEQPVIDFGTPAARALLIDGWYTQDEQWARGRPFVWGTGRHSSLDLHLVTTRPLQLSLEGRPLPRNLMKPDLDIPPQVVTVKVNDLTVGRLRLAEGFRSYAVDIPARVLVEGRNRLDLDYFYSPRDEGYLIDPPADLVSRTIAWATATIDGAAATDRPRADTEARQLNTPFGTGVEYFVAPPAGASLDIAELTNWGDGSGGHLDVHVTTDAGEVAPAVTVQPDTWIGPPTIPLPEVEPNDMVRVALFARAGEGGGGGGLTLTQPRLLAASGTDRRAETDAAAALRTALYAAGQNRPHVLIYLIDTLRADHLGSYGYSLETSPNLDAFARDAIRFTRSMAQSSWTRASVASIFTGLHPRSHAVNGRTDTLSPKAVTLAGVLRATGYQTAGFITNGNVSKNFGLHHGFDDYVYLQERRTAEIHVQSDALNEGAFGWLENRGTERPFSLYLHSVDPHDPYTPRSPFRERFIEAQQFPELVALRTLLRARLTADEIPAVSAELTALYDAEIAHNDHHFGQLMQWLRDHDLYDQTLIFIMSDHGEAFHDHGRWGRGNTLYQEQIAVPLIVKLPGQVGAGRTVDDLAQHVDIMPSILDLLGVPIPDVVQGRSLWPTVASGRVDPHTTSTSYLKLDGQEMKSLQTATHKLIRFPVEGQPLSRTELYDLAADPAELEDLSRTRQVAGGYFLSALQAVVLDRPVYLETSEAVLDEELADRLRALGYIR